MSSKSSKYSIEALWCFNTMMLRTLEKDEYGFPYRCNTCTLDCPAKNSSRDLTTLDMDNPDERLIVLSVMYAEYYSFIESFVQLVQKSEVTKLRRYVKEMHTWVQ